MIMSDENFIDELFGSSREKWLNAVVHLKNMAIGNNKQKTFMLNAGVAPRLLEFMVNESNVDVELRIEAAVLLGSLAKGSEVEVRAVMEVGAVSVLLKGLEHGDIKYMEACLRCLRTIFASGAASLDLLYEDPSVIPHMISLLAKTRETELCVSSIIFNCCKCSIHQEVLCGSGAIDAIVPLLASNVPKVNLLALKCFSALVYRNHQVAQVVATTRYAAEAMPNAFARFLQRNRSTETQLWAAKCLTYLYRSRAMDPKDPIISHKTLPTTVRLCQKDKTWEERVDGAETLAYLIEVDPDLQQIASISEHLITTLADYFKYPGSPPDSNLMPKTKDEISVGNQLRSAAFHAYASLASNDENIRKEIIKTENLNLMEHLINGLSDPVSKVQLSALRCLHSLSRSVQQLRTNFQDHAIWKPLLKILQGVSSNEMLSVASAILCNLLLEFSPSKEPILEAGIIDVLVRLVDNNDNSALRLHGIWAFMNLAFQSEQRLKSQILEAITVDRIFRLLSEPEIDIRLKTLGLLRNLLTVKAHIDQTMSSYGAQILQSALLALEGADHLEDESDGLDIREQAVCLLANIADGASSRELIMSNDDILVKLLHYLKDPSIRLQIAATSCISNLLSAKDEGAALRQQKLKELGIHGELHRLLQTNDVALLDKVKSALNQF